MISAAVLAETQRAARPVTRVEVPACSRCGGYTMRTLGAMLLCDNCDADLLLRMRSRRLEDRPRQVRYLEIPDNYEQGIDGDWTSAEYERMFLNPTPEHEEQIIEHLAQLNGKGIDRAQLAEHLQMERRNFWFKRWLETWKQIGELAAIELQERAEYLKWRRKWLAMWRLIGYHASKRTFTVLNDQLNGVSQDDKISRRFANIEIK